MAAAKSPPRYACALCGTRRIAEDLVYSSHTGRRFCWRAKHTVKCRRAYEKRKRAEKEAEALRGVEAAV